MRKLFRKLISAIMAALLIASLIPFAEAASYKPSTTTVKIGLYYGSGALDGANLENVDGCGSGYEFGYIDSNRNFVSVGASTSETKISMVIDRNMYYSSGNYYAGTSGDTVIGCYHIRLNQKYSSYSSAKSAASNYSSSFVKYLNGAYYVMIGNYTSADSASSAAASRGISGYVIDSGTAYTVAVVATGTSKILFEYDCGADSSLTVRPSASGVKAKTWFKGYKYYGAFQYARVGGGKLTVSNVLNVEDYVKGVIPYEISPSWPIEAQKAAAICGRTYVMANLNKHKAYGFDVCSTVDCQVYHGTNSATSTSDSAVDETKGQYLLSNGSLCTAFYMSCDGGATENSENIWYAAEDYLRGVKDPYEEKIASSISGYYWTKSYTASELTAYLQRYGYNCSAIQSVKLVLTDMGNVYSITVIDSNGKEFTFSKERARTSLGFNSQRYTIEGGTVSDKTVTYSGDNFVFSGSGSGHNVGMSQWGAYSMAKYYDKSCKDILTFYFSGTEIVATDSSTPVPPDSTPTPEPEPEPEPTPDTKPGISTMRTNQKINFDGKSIALEVYNINDENYFKLRDIAYIMNGTSSRFSVSMGEGHTIYASTGEAYYAIGGEMSIGEDKSSTCVLSNWTLYVNGEKVTVTAYNLGGNNFFRLRDLGSALGFGVDYEKSTRTVLITSGSSRAASALYNESDAISVVSELQ